MLELIFNQEAVLGNEAASHSQQNNKLRTETRHFFDRRCLAKAVNKIVGPAKKMAVAEGHCVGLFASIPFYSSFF
jgi:hypothetical protein